jgi:hypothetical protein
MLEKGVVDTSEINKNVSNSGGYNLYISKGENPEKVYLRDLSNEIRYEWTLPETSKNQGYHHVTPFSDGSLIITKEQLPNTIGDYIVLDKDSSVLNTIEVPDLYSHHDSEPLEDGSILGLFLRQVEVEYRGNTIPVIDDVIARVTAGGEIIESVSLYEIYKDTTVFKDKLARAHQHSLNPETNMALDIRFKKLQVPGYDFFHSNSIELIKKDIPGVARKGDWLVSVRNIDSAVIIRPETQTVVWEWGSGEVAKPHYATIINGDTLLYFDNGRDEKQTRAIEVDMVEKEIVWQYGQKQGQEFYTDIMGGAQRLSNGNTLLMVSTQGRVIEVNREGMTVRDWINPSFASRKDTARSSKEGKLGMIYRTHRIDGDFFIDSLDL